MPFILRGPFFVLNVQRKVFPLDVSTQRKNFPLYVLYIRKKTKGLPEQVGKPFASQLTLTVNYLSK
jgi:hypothetical protein